MAATTKEVLLGMLTENTGRSLLDSGGGDGRHWQQNALRDLEAEPAVTLRFSVARDGTFDIYYTRSVFHFLRNRIRFSPDMNELFQSFRNRDKDAFDLAIMEAFCRKDRFYFTTVNTYNGESNLSQTLQFVLFGPTERYTHCLLQIHGGADVRGGYTQPIAFELAEPLSLLRVADGGIRCPACGESWYSDDNFRWLLTQDWSGVQLQNRTAKIGTVAEKDVVVVTSDGKAFCPCCGKGLLESDVFEDASDLFEDELD